MQHEVKVEGGATALALSGDVTGADEAQFEAMSKSLVNKIAHGPISALRRNAGQPDGDQIIDAVRKVFHLQD